MANNWYKKKKKTFFIYIVKASSYNKFAVQIADVYQKNVKRVDQLMNVQIVLGNNVAAGMLLTIDLP